MAEVLVASGLNVKVYVDDALTILLVTAKIHEAPIINLYLKSLKSYLVQKYFLVSNNYWNTSLKEIEIKSVSGSVDMISLFSFY